MTVRFGTRITLAFPEARSREERQAAHAWVRQYASHVARAQAPWHATGDEKTPYPAPIIRQTGGEGPESLFEVETPDYHDPFLRVWQGLAEWRALVTAATGVPRVDPPLEPGKDYPEPPAHTVTYPPDALAEKPWDIVRRQNRYGLSNPSTSSLLGGMTVVVNLKARSLDVDGVPHIRDGKPVA